MVTPQHVGAAALGPAAPTRPKKDYARELGSGAGAEAQGTTDSRHFRSISFAEQAALTIEGEQCAAAYMARLQADAVHPDELAALLSTLSGEMLHGACRAIEKSLRGGRHA